MMDDDADTKPEAEEVMTSADPDPVLSTLNSFVPETTTEAIKEESVHQSLVCDSPAASNNPDKVLVEDLKQPVINPTIRDVHDVPTGSFDTDEMSLAASKLLQESLLEDEDLSTINLLELVEKHANEIIEDEKKGAEVKVEDLKSIEVQGSSKVKENEESFKNVKMEPLSEEVCKIPNLAEDLNLDRPPPPQSVSSIVSDSSTCQSPSGSRRISQRRMDHEIHKKAQEIRKQTLEEERIYLEKVNSSAQNSPVPRTPGHSFTDNSQEPDGGNGKKKKKTRGARDRERKQTIADSSSEDEIPLKALTNIKIKRITEETETSAVPPKDPKDPEMQDLSIKLDRLTNDELLKWTGSEKPEIWVPMVKDASAAKKRGRPKKTDIVEKIKIKKLKVEEAFSSDKTSDSDKSAPESKPKKKPKRLKDSSESDSDDNHVTTPSKSRPPLKIALKVSSPEHTLKKKKQTNVQKLIKERSLPKAHHIASPQPMSSSGDRCLQCTKRREKWNEEVEMPHNSVYCSQECIMKTVLKAKSVIRNEEEKLMLLEKGTGAVLNGPNAPNVNQLESFLISHSSYYPMLPEKKEAPAPECKPSAPLSSVHQDLRKAPAILAPDRKRLEVRRVLKEVLLNRANEAGDVLMSETEVRVIAIRIEEELFKACHSQVSQKYKNWFRAALTNLKSTSNKGLFRRILSGEITPSKAAHLKPEDLASKELAKWDASKPELLLDEDIASILDGEKKKKPIAVVKAQDPVADDPMGAILGLLVRDTTQEHKSHLFDLNCKICTGKQQPNSEEKEKRKKMRTERKKQMSESVNSIPPIQKIEHQPNWSPTFQHVHTPAHMAVADEYDEYDAVPADDDYEPPSPPVKPSPRGPKTPPPPAMRGPSTPPLPSHSTPKHLKSRIGANSHRYSITPLSPSNRPRSGEGVYGCWNGQVMMSSYFHFPCTSVLLSGSTRIDIAKDLPNVLNIVGRIPPRVVWDYLTDIRKNISKHVFVLYLVPPEDPLERQQYDGLYENMRKKQKFCVIGKNIDPKKIKDCYVFPLAKEEIAPEELLVNEGPGFPKNRDNLIIVVIVSHHAHHLEKMRLADMERKAQMQEMGTEENSPPITGPRTPAQEPGQPYNYSPTQVPVSCLPHSMGRNDKAEMRSIIYGGMGLAPQPSGHNDEREYEAGELREPVLRPLVADLLKDIKTGEKEPAQVATMVQHFLGENDLTEEEQRWVLESLNDCVNRHQDRIEGENDEEDVGTGEPYEPGSIQEHHTPWNETPGGSRNHEDSADRESRASNVSESDNKPNNEFYDWMMQRMVAAMDPPPPPPAPQLPPPPPPQAPPPTNNTSMDMDIEDNDAPDNARSLSHESAVHLPPPPMAPPIPPTHPSVPHHEPRTIPLNSMLEHGPNESLSTRPPPPDREQGEVEHWGRGSAWDKPHEQFVSGEWEPAPSGEWESAPSRDWKRGQSREWEPAPSGEWESAPSRDWKRGQSREWEPAPAREWRPDDSGDWEPELYRRSPGENSRSMRGDLNFGQRNRRGRGSRPPRRGSSRHGPHPNRDRPRVDYGDVEYDQWDNRGPHNFRGRPQGPPPTRRPMWNEQPPEDLMEWAEEPEFGVPGRPRPPPRPYRNQPWGPPQRPMWE